VRLWRTYSLEKREARTEARDDLRVGCACGAPAVSRDAKPDRSPSLRVGVVRDTRTLQGFASVLLGLSHPWRVSPARASLRGP